MVQYLKNTTVIVATVFLVYTVTILQVYAAPTVTPGGLLYFSGELDFEQAFPGLALEDFEESPIAPSAILPLPEPLDESTNVPGVFAPGDIQPGLAIQSVEGTMPLSGLFVIGDGHYSNSSKAVGINWTLDNMDILFSGDDVHAVGMDLMLPVAANVTISIYGPGNTLLDMFNLPIQVTETFFGVYSTNPITHVVIVSAGLAELVDNIQFGAIAPNLTFYTDRTAFEIDYSGLPKEDFEESPVAPGSQVIFGEPLENSTNAPGAFAPGDIMDDIHIQTVSTLSPAISLQVLGENYLSSMGNPSKLVCSAAGLQDDLQVKFYNITATGAEIDTYAVGMDLMQWHPATYPPVDVVVSVYDINSRFLGATKRVVQAGDENFVGIFSKKPIVMISIQSTNNDHECVDNIQFGGLPRGLTFYSTESDFAKARNNLPMEDFSKSSVTATGPPQLCDEPIDSTTDQAGCFSPGDILPNVTFRTEESLDPTCPNCLALYAPNSGTLGNATPILAASPYDLLEILFSGKRVHYAGMSVYSRTIASIYGPNDTLLGAIISYPATSEFSFKGVKSSEPISRITIDGILAPAVLDSVMFGGKFPWAMYQPAINDGTGGLIP